MNTGGTPAGVKEKSTGKLYEINNIYVNFQSGDTYTLYPLTELTIAGYTEKEKKEFFNNIITISEEAPGAIAKPDFTTPITMVVDSTPSVRYTITKMNDIIIELKDKDGKIGRLSLVRFKKFFTNLFEHSEGGKRRVRKTNRKKRSTKRTRKTH